MESVLGLGYSLELFGHLAQEIGVSSCVLCWCFILYKNHKHVIFQ